MATRDVVEGYFECLKAKRGWEAFLSEGLQFTSFASPIKRATGREAYLEATKRFYSMIRTLEIRGMLVEGARACVLTRYELQPPSGPVFESHVAEVFDVQGDQIQSLDIYFDTAPFPR